MGQYGQDPLKAAQAAARVLLTHPARRMEYIRLLKLLYIAERESFRERAAPILADRVRAMKHGPVFSTVYDFIKGDHFEAGVWSQWVGKDGYDVHLIKDPGTSKLSPYETQKLEEIARRYADADSFDLVDLTHTFPEWVEAWNNRPPGKNAAEISIESLLRALGIEDEEAADIIRDLEFSTALTAASRKRP